MIYMSLDLLPPQVSTGECHPLCTRVGNQSQDTHHHHSRSRRNRDTRCAHTHTHPTITHTTTTTQAQETKRADAHTHTHTPHTHTHTHTHTPDSSPCSQFLVPMCVGCWCVCVLVSLIWLLQCKQICGERWQCDGRY